MLFPTKSVDSWCCKGRFYSQETAVLASINGGSWKWVLFLSASKTFISLITNAFCVMLQNSVFRQRMTMRRQISAVRAVRIAFLLNLFASIVGAWFITFRITRKTNNQWQCASVGAWFITLKPSVLVLFRSSGAIICFNEGRRNVINQAPSVCTCRLFYAMLIPNWDKPKSVTIQHFEVNA